MKFSNSKKLKLISNLKNSLKWLSALVTAFVLQVGFLQAVFAQDVTTTSEQAPAVLLPDISFSTLEDGRVSIQAVGFNKSQVSRFTFDGQDVTAVIEDLKNNGVLEGYDMVIENEAAKIYPTSGFEMKLSIEPSILEGHSFGVALVNGLELHKTVKFSDDKGRYGSACVSNGLTGAGIGWGIGAVGGAGVASWFTAPVGLGAGFVTGCALGLIGEKSRW